MMDPIAGPGTETFAFISGWAWCGHCGYTGRCKGPRQAACRQDSWHAWLEQCVDALPQVLMPHATPTPLHCGNERAGAR
jgi:hypothetical protein